MYNNHKQMGRSRVNWKHDSKKTRKTHVQQKKINITQMDKHYSMQRQFIKDGMNFLQYKNYIQEKINNNMFYYRKLSEEDVSKLHQRYRRLVQEEDNKVNELLEYRKRNKRQKKLFKEKKRVIIDEQKSKMIDQLLKVMNKRDILTSDVNAWTRIKKLLFSGGYIEKGDEKWSEIYRKIVSPVSARLFNIHSHDALNEYIMNQ